MTQRRIHQDAYPYFITFNTAKGESVFEEEKLAKALAQTMRNAARLKGWTILAYQIMPNHIHLLTSKRMLESMRSEDETKMDIQKFPERTLSRVRDPKQNHTHSISDLMQSIKGNFSYKHKLGPIWQPRFYSRIVNTEKYLTTVVGYIQCNPVKDGLPPRYTKPPYQYFNWRKIKEAL